MNGAQVDLELAHGPDAPGVARQAVGAMLAAEGRDDLADRAALLTSELVTNAVLHGKGPIRLTARLGDALRVEVRDRASRAPARRSPGPDAVTGRGLMLVEHLSARWGFEREPGGKCVWFELSAESPAGTGSGPGAARLRAQRPAGRRREDPPRPERACA